MIQEGQIHRMITMWFFLGLYGFMLQVTFLGDGPLGQMTSISSAGSFVKGFVGNPLCQPPLKDNGRVWFTWPYFYHLVIDQYYWRNLILYSGRNFLVHSNKLISIANKHISKTKTLSLTPYIILNNFTYVNCVYSMHACCFVLIEIKLY